MSEHGLTVRVASRRVLSWAAVMLAVVMLVATGGARELLHGDEHEDSARPSVSAPFHLADQTAKAATGEKAAHHSCSGHCAAHTVDQPPALSQTPVLVAMTVSWSGSGLAVLRSHPPSGEDRPPRL